MASGGGSSSSRAMPSLPAGFRFHPTDEELIVHYLMNQAASIPCPVPIIAEVNIYQCNPWDLPAKALFGENEWYFFSPRDRKYPNGVRPNRAAGSGYWKATGTDKAILSTPTSRNIGVKKALVFYGGKPPRGVKTDWIMHEYRLTGMAAADDKKKPRGSSMRLDDWVLCRIHKKSNDFQVSWSSDQEHEHEGSTLEEADGTLVNTTTMNNDSTETTTLLGHHHHDQQQLHHHHQTPPPAMAMAMTMTTMSKSCSLTDLLNSIDCASLSQMLLLDGPAADADEPPLIYPSPPATQTTTHQALVNTANNYDDNSVTMNSSSHIGLLPTAAAVDPVLISSQHNTNGVKKRKRVMAVDGGAAAAAAAEPSSFDDGGRKLMKLPSDSRNAAGHFGTTYNYNQLQQQLVADSTSSGGFHQYSSMLLGGNNHPFLNQHQLLLNTHIGMQ